MAPLSHSQEVQIQWGKLSTEMHRQSSQVARRLRQLKFKWVQKFFLALICSEFMLNSFEYGISYLFSSSSLLPSLQLSSCLSVFVQSVPRLWFLTCGGFALQYLCSECTVLCKCAAFSSGCCQGVMEVPIVWKCKGNL
ncbi:hypothetical protein RLOC_00002220 [Lonchura striata]|uniref:Uncharacterized protein n=1 Tax=Lonchura striata TaxID=40157 RepID=A0A218VEW9_9PASE|nr:hypothetical protein RLOC_00002220 [Lonchura striata domestica]